MMIVWHVLNLLAMIPIRSCALSINALIIFQLDANNAQMDLLFLREDA